MDTIQSKNFPPYLTRTLQDLLTDTSTQVNNCTIPTHIGVAQGCVLSPTLFNIFFDKLIRTLVDSGAETLAFADDLAFRADGQIQLYKCIKIVEKWAQDSSLQINL